MNRMQVCKYDFFDDFYELKWNIAANAGSVSIVHDGMQGDRGCVQLVDNSTGRTAINIFNPLLRDNDVRTPPDLEVEQITKTNIATEHERSVIYKTINYGGDYPNGMPTTNEWFHCVIRYFWRDKTNPALCFVTTYRGYKHNIYDVSRALVTDAIRHYIGLANTISLYTFYSPTGTSTTDLVAYRQVHLYPESQYRPNSQVYEHIHNGRGKEVGTMQVGGVM